MSTPTTFHAHGQDWYPHTPGDPCPCEGSAKIAFILRGDVNQRFQSEANFANRLNWDSRPFGSANAEVIGWRFATPPQEKDELTRLREIVAACMKAMPCGNIATHTPENLAGRISELAQALAAESLDNERLIKENASMRTAIKFTVTVITGIQLSGLLSKHCERILAKLSPFTESK